MVTEHVRRYFDDVATIAKQIDQNQVERMIEIIVRIRAQKGRLFFLGVGGSAGNCSHAVNDFRKIAGVEAYTPVDNVSELSARTNDEGWHTVFSAWLADSHLNEKDGIFILSVGGGSKEKNISANLVYALEFATKQKAKILGIVGRDGGFTAKVADACVIVPTVNADTVTPHAESFQANVWHLIVSDPRLMRMANKWESVTTVK